MANAADVKRLRDETGAPMMECKAALDEAGGDFEKAKEILREKGQAAAGKRQGRSTSEGYVAVSMSDNHQEVGAVVLESETDFVAKNEGFIALAKELAEIFQHHDPGSDPLAVKHGDKSVNDLIQECIAKFRENIKLTSVVHIRSENKLAAYVHHDFKKGVIIEYAGEAANGHDVARQVAIQAVAFPPEYISKDQVPGEYVAKQLELETQRAINEGKPENIAKNIAQGRVDKEIMKQVVLLEQPFYREPSKSVNAYLSDESKAAGHQINILSFKALTISQD